MNASLDWDFQEVIDDFEILDYGHQSIQDMLKHESGSESNLQLLQTSGVASVYESSSDSAKYNTFYC